MKNIYASHFSARSATNSITRSYNETTLQQLKTVLLEKITQPGGTNLDELANAVDRAYSFLKPLRDAVATSS